MICRLLLFGLLSRQDSLHACHMHNIGSISFQFEKSPKTSKLKCRKPKKQWANNNLVLQAIVYSLIFYLWKYINKWLEIIKKTTEIVGWMKDLFCLHEGTSSEFRLTINRISKVTWWRSQLQDIQKIKGSTLAWTILLNDHQKAYFVSIKQELQRVSQMKKKRKGNTQ